MDSLGFFAALGFPSESALGWIWGAKRVKERSPRLPGHPQWRRQEGGQVPHLQGVAWGADVVDQVSQQGLTLAAVPQQDPGGCSGHLHPQVQDLVQPSPNCTGETGVGVGEFLIVFPPQGGRVPGSSRSGSIRPGEGGGGQVLCCPTRGQNRRPSKGGQAAFSSHALRPEQTS